MPAEVKILLLMLKTITTDRRTQMRASIDQETLDDYAEAIEDGADFPPVIVFWDGRRYWLADGWHRYLSHQKIGRKAIAAQVLAGGIREAILFAAGANHRHGLKRTNDDKRHAVRCLLDDEQWSRESNRWLADKAGVSEFLVRAMRDVMCEEIADTPDKNEDEEQTVTAHRGGVEYTMRLPDRIDKRTKAQWVRCPHCKGKGHIRKGA